MVVSVAVYDAAIQVVAEEVQYSQTPCLEVDTLNKIDWIVVTGVYLSPECFKIIHLEIWTEGYL